MKKEPKSKVLFLTICSLTKARGGEPGYDDSQGMAAILPDFKDRLLARREEVRRFVRSTTTVHWQGVPLSQLGYNRDLNKGQDFGGHRTAAYLPALRRYEGRFFQALGAEGREKLRRPDHHVLFLSGLYGLLRPLESVQLYSCPLASEVAGIWRQDALLTDLLCSYIKRHEIIRIFDMTALDAYRHLIDWQRIDDLSADVLHCFSEMASGDYALTFFGKTLASDFLDLSEDELLDLSSGTEVEDVKLWQHSKAPLGFPEEISSILQAYEEKDILQSWTVENVKERIQGGNPTPEARNSIEAECDWKFTISSTFSKQMERFWNLTSKVMKAILEIRENPVLPRGDIIKPYTKQKNKKGFWRYRIGNYRIVYKPDEKHRIVHLLGIFPRGDL